MANTSKINGFRPVKHLNGSPYNGQFNLYEIPAGDGTATMVGDLVKGDGTANTQSAYPTAVRHGTSGEVTSGEALGAIIGFVPAVFASGSQSTVGAAPALDAPNYRVASTKRLAMVADAPDLIFEVEDGGTVPCTWTLIGMNTGFLATAGSTTTGASGMTSGTTAPTTTATLPLRIMGIVQSPDNESATVAGQAYQKLLVMINTHRYGSVGTTGV